MIFLQENDFWILFILGLIALLGFGLSVITSRKYIRCKIVSLFTGKKTVLREDKDGICRWMNQKVDCGYLISDDGHTQIARKKIVRTDEGDFYVQTQGFGLTYDLSIAEAVNFLEENGFVDLVQALKKYDSEYFDQTKNPENYAKLKEAIEKDKEINKNLYVNDIMKDARTKLLTFDIRWISTETVPLGVIYRWALQNNGSMTNLNMYEKGVLMAKQENLTQGWTQEKTTFMIMGLGGLIIIGAIGFYIFTIAGMNAPHQAGTTIATTTTTTIAEVINGTLRT